MKMMKKKLFAFERVFHAQALIKQAKPETKAKNKHTHRSKFFNLHTLH